MYRIVIKDQIKATQAISWCKENVSLKTWDLDTQWPNAGFVFSFNQEKDASWFGLHWAH